MPFDRTEKRIVVTGMTASENFPTTEDAFCKNYSVGGGDAFVTIITPCVIGYPSFLGGSGKDNGEGVAVDRYGSFYLTGQTSSSDFPTTQGVLQEI